VCTEIKYLLHLTIQNILFCCEFISHLKSTFVLLKDLKYTILLLSLSKEQKDIFGSVYIKSQMLTIAYRLFTQKKIYTFMEVKFSSLMLIKGNSRICFIEFS
jgi:hypothetical protein